MFMLWKDFKVVSILLVLVWFRLVVGLLVRMICG